VVEDLEKVNPNGDGEDMLSVLRRTLRFYSSLTPIATTLLQTPLRYPASGWRSCPFSRTCSTRKAWDVGAVSCVQG
jgi:hypothetical protein